jgi:hypothetical protein
MEGGNRKWNYEIAAPSYLGMLCLLKILCHVLFTVIGFGDQSPWLIRQVLYYLSHVNNPSPFFALAIFQVVSPVFAYDQTQTVTMLLPIPPS